MSASVDISQIVFLETYVYPNFTAVVTILAGDSGHDFKHCDAEAYIYDVLRLLKCRIFVP